MQNRACYQANASISNATITNGSHLLSFLAVPPQRTLSRSENPADSSNRRGDMSESNAENASGLVINCWSGPRCCSTSLMYSFAQRSDTQVLDEPLYASYLKRSGVPRPYTELVSAHIPLTIERSIERPANCRRHLREGTRVYVVMLAQLHHAPAWPMHSLQ